MIKKITLITLTIAAIGFSACQQKQTAGPSVVIDPDTLSREVALKYVANYGKHAGTVDSTITDAQGLEKKKQLPNTRAIYFSIERMEALVKKIKDEGGQGIRFYLAAYDSTYTKGFNGRKPAKDYWGYNTLVMVSTKDTTINGTLYHWDYYNQKPPAGKNGGLQGSIIGTTPENRGEQCPPPATCSTTGATLVQP
ncbi:hypothetical protein [Mucilaginibacter sp. OK283]|jgi:hypothetical protein|uniref:hypothetical protein n=1 Tax=Mucilaginibacter sp. OK283 TaxID=1881049 RepID=UPI0008CA7A11|nr:hypothetical protein [Mucilaginibacter sp. OK283]SEP32965.1 hypothetical protein SAMN05428947_11158 [Mucilaginibacter sp. OK283]